MSHRIFTLDMQLPMVWLVSATMAFGACADPDAFEDECNESCDTLRAFDVVDIELSDTDYYCWQGIVDERCTDEYERDQLRLPSVFAISTEVRESHRRERIVIRTEDSRILAPSSQSFAVNVGIESVFDSGAFTLEYRTEAGAWSWLLDADPADPTGQTPYIFDLVFDAASQTASGRACFYDPDSNDRTYCVPQLFENVAIEQSDVAEYRFVAVPFSSTGFWSTRFDEGQYTVNVDITD